MVDADLFGIRIPFYVLAMLFFSYLIWAKFKNKGALGFKKGVDDILDVLGIFVVVMVTVIELVVTLTAPGEVFRFSFDVLKTWEATKIQVGIFSVFLILLFMGLYRKKEVSKNELDDMMSWMMTLQMCLFAIISGYLILGVTTVLNKVFLGQIALLWLIFAMLSGTCYYITKTAFIDPVEHFRKREFFKNNKWDVKTYATILFIVLASTIIIIDWFTLPKVVFDSSETSEYHIYDAGRGSQKVYKLINVPLRIKSLGWYDSQLKFIPVDYGKLNIAVRDDAADNFRIWAMNSEDKIVGSITNNFPRAKSTNKIDISDEEGFIQIRNLENENLLLLEFDKNTLKEKNVSYLEVMGYVEDNITEFNFTLEDDKFSCNPDGCLIFLNLKSNLDKTTNIKRINVLNFRNTKVENVNNCSIRSITQNSYEPRDTRFECNNNYCEFELYGRGGQVYDSRLRIEDTVLSLDYATIESPLIVNKSINISC